MPPQSTLPPASPDRTGPRPPRPLASFRASLRVAPHHVPLVLGPAGNPAPVDLPGDGGRWTP